MTKNKKAAKVAPDGASDVPNSGGVLRNAVGFFPFARYASIVGVHTTLLLFTAFFLPRTKILSELAQRSVDFSQLTSRDRPQHPFLEALTTSPAMTVACMCAGSVVLQGWWGGWTRDWWFDYTSRGFGDSTRVQKADFNSRKLSALRNAWALTLASSAIFYAALVLFGAPLLSHWLQTYLLALFLSILVIFTPAYTYGLPTLSSDTESLVVRMTWVRLFAEFSVKTPVERAIVYPAVGTLVGCWLGAVPIALDWDRPWQAWPLTPTFGALAGYILASIGALTASAVTFLAMESIRNERQKTI
ncbi:GPI biosynthesis protein family Pig-F-domain-containing protein [Desarmillaria ectypa]|nr:GPI biosynthesis protein family Pig-F-domain-containing protein [Desarmillaria ectypa]